MGRVFYMIGTFVMKELNCGVNITYILKSEFDKQPLSYQ